MGGYITRDRSYDTVPPSFQDADKDFAARFGTVGGRRTSRLFYLFVESGGE